MTFVHQQLSSRMSRNTASHRDPNPKVSHSSTSSSSDLHARKSTEVEARLSRESSERARALELVRRRKRELEGGETPSTVHGGIETGYTDVFNRKEVEEAHKQREHRWARDLRGGNRQTIFQPRR